MIRTKFDWDKGKAAANAENHLVSFDEASTIFGDPLSATIPDPDHSIDETRFVTIGQTVAGRLIVVSHTEGEEAIRIISAREPGTRERKRYESKS